MFCLTSLIVASVLAANPEEPAAANLKPAPTIASEYESRKAQTGRDADAQIKLALWCEQHGLEQERLKHLGAVVLRDPTNALARGLLGLVEYKGTWKRPEAVADAIKTDVAHADLLVEYNARRVKTPVAAGPQYKLGLWCEEKGLTDEARAHFATALRLEPTNVDSLKKLGYKKVGNRWITERQAAFEKAEREAQTAADREWKPRFEALHSQFKSKTKRADAERMLAEISHVRAVPMLLKTFVGGDVDQQQMTVQVLGQIDAIESSRALAKYAMFAESADIRARATATLRRRDPREWADLPLVLLRSRINYKMKPVGGPTDPGFLEITTKTTNYKRIYRPGAAYQIQPGDRIFTDASGQQIVSRLNGIFETGQANIISSASWQGARDTANALGLPPGIGPNIVYAYATQNALVLDQPVILGPNANAVTGQLNHALQGSSFAGQGERLASAAVATEQNFQRNLLTYSVLGPEMAAKQWVQRGANSYGFLGSNGLLFEVASTTNVPLAQLQRDALNSQSAAVDSLNADKSLLDDYNRNVSKTNSRSLDLLTTTTGLAFGDDREAWDKWFTTQIGYAYVTPQQAPTVVEEVPTTFQSQVTATASLDMLNARIPPPPSHNCFGKGTLVRTPSGARAIEDLKIGDLVLSQEMASGKLHYKPIVAVHHNPPSPTHKIMLNGEALVSSHFHRFWKVGQGWVMARDLKVDDKIRVLGSVATISSIEPSPVQPVFNLNVADDSNFFVGSIAALVYDASIPDLKLVPFDAVATQTK